jgi:ribosomal protein S6--L-glutamate ligase
MVVADQNLLCAGRDPGPKDLKAIQQADVVILPQGCRESLYRLAADNCPHVFPNYDARFAYPEKIGQAQLFQQMAVPFPHTIRFENKTLTDTAMEKLLHQSPLELPFVFKFNWGGEGESVFLVRNHDDFKQNLEKAQLYTKSGQYGFVLQEFIPSNGRSLRVVVINETLISYWRIQDNDDGFYTNISKGARLELDADPDLKTSAIAATQQFCKKTGINLAGFDFLFSETALSNDKIEPLFLEINYFFGRKGLGGSEKYYKLLQQGIADWLKSIKAKI